MKNCMATAHGTSRELLATSSGQKILIVDRRVVGSHFNRLIAAINCPPGGPPMRRAACEAGRLHHHPKNAPHEDYTGE